MERLNNKPNLFVVGAPKAGTTTLYHVLVQHNDVFCAREKELHYFSQSHMVGNYYHTKRINNIDSYLSNYKNADNKRYIGDFSPSYMYHMEALESIKRFNPDSKVIIALRNPVMRSLSHYLMDVSKGFQKHALVEILTNPGKYPDYYYQYITLSRYSSYVRGCINVFGKNNVLLLFSEKMRQDPTSEFQNLFSFLNLDNTSQISLDIKSNKSFVPVFGFLRNVRANKIASNMFQSIPFGLRAHIKNLLTKDSSDMEDYSEAKKLLEDMLRVEMSIFENALNNSKRNCY